MCIQLYVLDNSGCHTLSKRFHVIIQFILNYKWDEIHIKAYVFWNTLPQVCKQMPAELMWRYIAGLVQDCSNPIALAMELLQSCTKPCILMFMPNRVWEQYMWHTAILAMISTKCTVINTNMVHAWVHFVTCFTIRTGSFLPTLRCVIQYKMCT